MKQNPSNNWLVAVAVGFLVAGCASTGAKHQATPATADRPEPGKGLIIFYREGHFSGGVDFVIFDTVKEPTGTALGSGPQIGGLPNGGYIVYNATPGEHTFASSTMARQLHYRRVDIESNRVRYVRAELVKSRTGGIQSIPELTVVDSEEGSAAIKNLKRVTGSQ